MTEREREMSDRERANERDSVRERANERDSVRETQTWQRMVFD